MMSNITKAFLTVGSSGHGKVVVHFGIDSVGHILFSPNEARLLASTLLSNADKAEQEVSHE